MKLSERTVVYIVIGILILTTLGDIYTALRNPALFKIAETNPIYIVTGSPVPLLIINVIVVLWFLTSLKKSISIIKIFTFTLMAIYLSLGHGFGIWSNLTATEAYVEDPVAFVEDYTGTTEAERVSSYFLFVGIIMMMPIIVSFIAFYLTIFFYQNRKSKREKIMDEIYILSTKLVRG